jgi:hypothetical protein
MAWPLAPHDGGRDFPEFLIHNRQETGRGLRIAVTHLRHKPGNLASLIHIV